MKRLFQYLKHCSDFLWSVDIGAISALLSWIALTISAIVVVWRDLGED
jgi:hypothetical protein